MKSSTFSLFPCRFTSTVCGIAASLLLLAGSTPGAPEISVEHAPGMSMGTAIAWGTKSFYPASVPAGLDGLKAVAAGVSGSLFLKNDGTVVGGTYGDGTSPGLPPGLTGVTAIAAGYDQGNDFFVALKNDGTVQVWSYDVFGVAHITYPGLSGITAISAGGGHLLALRNDGTVAAWGGGNPFGQLSVPAGLSGVVAVAAGGSHSAALKSDGSIVEWGDSANHPFDPVRTRPAGLSPAQSLAASSGSTFAVRANGTVDGWGGGAPTDAVGISACVAHAVAVNRNGTVVDWGWGYAETYAPAPANLAGVTQAAAGMKHAVALIGQTVSFGSQPVGFAGPARILTIRNAGTSPLAISSVALSGANSADFLLNTSGMLASVPGGGSTTFSVSMTAMGTGERTASLRLLNDDASEGTFDILLNGTGTAPEIQVSGNGQTISDGDSFPSVGDHTEFGAVEAIGFVSTARTFTITNNGATTLQLTGTPLVASSLPLEFTVTSQPAATVAPGGSTTFQITFDPRAAGGRTATISIPSNDLARSPFDFTISGAGLAAGIPEISITGNGEDAPHASVSAIAANHTWFGDVPTAGGTVTRTYTISNAGPDPLHLAGTPPVQLELGNAADFTVIQQPAVTVLAAGASTTFQIRFDPSADYQRATRVVIANDDIDESPYTFWIGGNGVGLPPMHTSTPGGPLLGITTGSLPGSVQQDRGAPITERGIVYAPTAVNPDPVIGGPGAVKVTATTAGLGDFSVAVAGLSADTSYTYKAYGINLAGTGYSEARVVRTLPLPPEIVISGNGVEIPNGDYTNSPANDSVFGSFPLLSGSATHTFTIANTGPGTLHLTGNPAVVSTLADFTVTQPGSTVIPAGGTTTFQVTFDPASGGHRAALILVSSDDADEGSYSFRVTGFGALEQPTVVSPAAGSVHNSSASLGGNVTGDGGGPIIERGVVFSSTSENPNPVKGGAGVTTITSSGTLGAFTVPVTGLQPGTNYTFKAYAANSQSTGYSVAGAFTTQELPEISAPASANAAYTTVQLSGNVTSSPGSTVIERGVVFAPASLNTDAVIGGPDVIKISTGGALGVFHIDVTGLTPSTSYTFKAYATNAAGTAYTLPASFSTLAYPLPSAGTVAISNVTGISAEAGTTVQTEGPAITARGILISPADVNANPYPGGAGVVNLSGAPAAGSLLLSVSGLTPGVTYAVKAYAVSSVGTGYSTVVFFRTSGGPAPQIIVTTTADENDSPAGASVSLREAVRDAAAGSTVGFAASLDGQIILLTLGQISISGKAITVDAGGLVQGIVVDAQRQSRHFTVNGGAGLTLTKAVLQAGLAASAGHGGAILSSGTLTLTDCTFRNNEAGSGAWGAEGSFGSPPGNGGNGSPGGSGGSIYHAGSVLTATRCRFLLNKAGFGGSGGMGGGFPSYSYRSGGCGGAGADGGSGGAIASAGTLTLADCLFDGNAAGAGGNGGSLGYTYTSSGPAYCAAEPVGQRGGASGSGGAVFHTGILSVTGSTFTANKCYTGGFGGNLNSSGGSYANGGAAGSGGGLACGSGAVILQNCTIARNTLQDGPYLLGGAGNGAGLKCAGTGTLQLVHCTITGNTAAPWRIGIADWRTGYGAGVFSQVPTQIQNCLIASNRNDRGPYGAPLWYEDNLAGSSMVVSPPSPFPNDTFPALPAPAVDPLLATETSTGVGLPVFPLLYSSPALNTGDILPGGPQLDQRGLPRSDNAPDLGAVEMQASELPVGFILPGDPDGDRLDNRIEAALNLDPALQNPPPLRLERRAGGTIHAVLPLRPRVTTSGWTARIEISDDMLQWTAPAPTVIPTGPGVDTLEIALPAGQKWFARLRASLTPP